jgi:hypothetical protein
MYRITGHYHFPRSKGTLHCDRTASRLVDKPTEDKIAPRGRVKLIPECYGTATPMRRRSRG